MAAPTLPICLIDDEQQLLESFFISLRLAGYTDIHKILGGRAALEALPNLDCALILLDLNMPDVPGLEILEWMQSERPDVQVVVVTGVDDAETAVRCMRAGAFDYLLKPVEPERLATTVQKALDHAVLLRQNLALRRKLFSGVLDQPEVFADILTMDPKMTAVFQYLEVIAPASDPVLITGETGTGKDLIARAVHQLSRRTGEYVSLNAAGLDDMIFTDTLFGHAKGAFTGAAEARRGLLGQARDGTLFLDEIGDLTLASQIKLLKVLQDRSYYPLGADQPRRSQTRFVAATNQDLNARQADGQFRRDLFFRLNTYHVHLPPLRERGDDVLLLAEHYLEQARAELNRPVEPLAPSLINLLRAYEFPGNIRELRAMLFDAVARGGLHVLHQRLEKLVTTASAPLSGEPCPPPRPIATLWGTTPTSLPTLEQAVQDLIQEALRCAHGNQSQAARLLGISRQALSKRLQRIRDQSTDPE